VRALNGGVLVVVVGERDLSDARPARATGGVE
jgi:hypothetical protein